MQSTVEIIEQAAVAVVRGSISREAAIAYIVQETNGRITVDIAVNQIEAELKQPGTVRTAYQRGVTPAVNCIMYWADILEKGDSNGSIDR
jgi:hypothetical protein